MAEESRQGRGRKFGVGPRIIVYAAIIGVLLYLRTNRDTPKDAAELPTVDNGLRVPQEPLDDMTEASMDLFLPRGTLYAWAVEITAEGEQVVVALLRLEANLDNLQWTELKLFGPKDSASELAVAAAPEDGSAPKPGMVLIRYRLGKDAPSFTEGRIWCWTKFLWTLQKGQKLSMEMLQANFQEALESEKSKPQPETPKTEETYPVDPDAQDGDGDEAAVEPTKA